MKLIKNYIPLIILSLFIVLFLFINIRINLFRYNNFDYGKFDLGNMTQMVWNTLHGRPLYLTDYFGANVPRWSMSHVDPILLLFVPIFAFVQSPLTMVFSQLILVVSCAYLIYFIAKLEFKSKLASLFFALSFLFYPAVGYLTATTGFHGVTAAMPFFFASFYIFERMYKSNHFSKKGLILFWLMLALTMTGKEQLPIYIALYGIFIILFRSGPLLPVKNLLTKISVKTGISMFIVGMLWFFLAFFVIIPYYAKYRVDGFNKFADSISLDTSVIRDVSAPNYFLSRYEEFGDSYTDIVINVLKDPAKVFQVVFGGDKLDNFNKTFAPVGYLPFANPAFMALAVPDLLINYLTTAGGVGTSEITNHRVSMVIPVLFISTIYSVSMFAKFLEKKKIRRVNFNTAVVVLSLFILVLNIKTTFDSNNPVYLWVTQAVQKKLLGGIAFAKEDTETAALKNLQIGQVLKLSKLENKDRECAQKVVDAIPENVSISGPDYLGAHLSMRETYAIFPGLYKEADYVIVDVFSKKILTILDVNLSLINDVVGWLIKSDDYEMVLGCGNLFVFHKTGPHNKPELLPMQENFAYPEKVSHEIYQSVYLVDFSIPKELVRTQSKPASFTYIRRDSNSIDDYVIFTTFINNETGQLYQVANLPSFGLIQLRDWKEDRYYTEQIDLALPQSIETGSYKAFVGISNGVKSRSIYLGDIQVK